jgi:hypothetical protein
MDTEEVVEDVAAVVVAVVVVYAEPRKSTVSGRKKPSRLRV